MRAWMQDAGEDGIAFVHGVSGDDLDILSTYCREKGEGKQSDEFKHAMRVDGAVIIDWCNKRGVLLKDFFRDEALQIRFMDDPENAMFRIWKGRV